MHTPDIDVLRELLCPDCLVLVFNRGKLSSFPWPLYLFLPCVFLFLLPFTLQASFSTTLEMYWKNMLSCQKEAVVNSHRQTLIGSSII